MSWNVHSFPYIIERMSNLEIAGYSLVFAILCLLAYRFLFNPQIVTTPTRTTASKCPERWSYTDGLCRPMYNTNCMPFDPSKITSIISGCKLARSCGTDWKGMCT
jgi:hypothetical protein